MNVQIVISLCVLFFQQLFPLKIQAKEICYYRDGNATRRSISCDDDCCSFLAASPDAACCSSVSWGSVAIPLFVFTGICMLVVSLVYCRPFWIACLCKHKCPCSKRTQVDLSNSALPHDNPIYILNNDDLPDYETTTKDGIPPSYNFVTAHPTDFGIATRSASIPPQYHSRRSSLTTIQPTAPTEY